MAADEKIDPCLRDQLGRYRRWLDDEELPIGVVLVMLSCWIQLQGFVAMEVHGPPGLAPLFEFVLAEMASRLGLPAPAVVLPDGTA